MLMLHYCLIRDQSEEDHGGSQSKFLPPWWKFGLSFGGSEVDNCVVYLPTREQERPNCALGNKVSYHPVYASEMQLTCLETYCIY